MRVGASKETCHNWDDTGLRLSTTWGASVVNSLPMATDTNSQLSHSHGQLA